MFIAESKAEDSIFRFTSVGEGVWKCRIFVAVMWFVVRVPVLLLYATLIDPSVPTDGKLLTIALLFDIRSTTNAKVTVIMIGRPFGIAVTTNDTAVWIFPKTTNLKRPNI
jgi:hypothetical protein